MQKKMIAVAVTGLVSGAACAQANVTMYGIADAAYLYSESNTKLGGRNEFSGIVSGGWNAVRVGWKGEEPLGNGLKAIFTLELRGLLGSRHLLVR